MVSKGNAWQGKTMKGMALQGVQMQGMERQGKARQGKAIHLDTFYYIFVIIFNPLWLDVLNFLFGRIDIWMWSS
jgi:hypothetical protein